MIIVQFNLKHLNTSESELWEWDCYTQCKLVKLLPQVLQKGLSEKYYSEQTKGFQALVSSTRTWVVTEGHDKTKVVHKLKYSTARGCLVATVYSSDNVTLGQDAMIRKQTILGIHRTDVYVATFRFAWPFENHLLSKTLIQPALLLSLRMGLSGARP